MSEPTGPISWFHDWFKPQTVIAVVLAMGSVVTFWVSFNQRVSDTAKEVSMIQRTVAENKLDQNARLDRIEDKLDIMLGASIAAQHKKGGDE